MARLDAESVLEQYGHWMSPGYKELLPYEADVKKLRVYGGLVVPGLLQSRTYITAANHQENIGRPNPEIDNEQRRLRLRRQEALKELPSGQVSFVIAEIAVHQTVSGDPWVRLSQVKRLIGKTYDFSVRLLPFDVGYVGAPETITDMTGPYGPEGEDERVIAWEAYSPAGTRGGIVRPTPPEQAPGPFEAYDHALDAAEAAALSVGATRERLDELHFRFKREAGLLP